jgi:probable rRNA maturation factor
MSKNVQLPSIQVRNLQRAVPVRPAMLEEFAARALKLCFDLPRTTQTDLMKLREVFVLIVSDRRMAHLHRQFLKEDGPTDVITFSHGEIVISAETARRHARQFGNSLKRELQLYVVHGLLHLHGFDDRTKAGARRMERVQAKILERAER